MRTRRVDQAPIRAVTIGIWQLFPLPMISRCLGVSGWDWVILDLQHGSMGFETAYECIQALSHTAARPLVRVSVGNPGEVQKALDMGAHGVVVPMVNSVAEAEALAQAAKYPPLGSRSLGGDRTLYQGEDYPDRANDETLLLVQIEHIDAVEAVEAIMAVAGVDGCLIGPTDLALSMGLPRKDYAELPRHRAAMERILRACQMHRKLACCNTYTIDDFQEKLSAGFDVITFKSEMDLLMSAGELQLAQLRNQVHLHNPTSALAAAGSLSKKPLSVVLADGT